MAYFNFSKDGVSVMLTTVKKESSYDVTLMPSPGWEIERCFFHSDNDASKEGNIYHLPLDTDAFRFRITDGTKRYELLLTKHDFVFRKAED